MAWLPGAFALLGFMRLLGPALRAGRGLVPVRRRLLAAALLAAVAAVPSLPAAFLPPTFARGLAQVATVDERGEKTWVTDAAEPQGLPETIVILFAWLWLLRTGMQMLRLPKELRHLDLMQPVADPALLARIGELARCLRTPPPRVLQPSALGNTMEIGAFAAGLLVPVVVVSDGVAHRLPPEERDAVLAHELAHVARRHLAWRFAALAAAGLAAVIASGFVAWYVAIAWFLGCVLFLQSVLGHRQELDADVRGARCAGFPAMAKGLASIHGANLQLDVGPWFHALQSHPALAVRREWLLREAPAEHRAAIVAAAHETGADGSDDAELAARCRRARGIALGAWIAALLAVLALGASRGMVPHATTLAVLLLLPPALPLLWFLGELKDAWQLGGAWAARRALRRAWPLLLALLALGGAWLAGAQARKWTVPGLLGLGALVLVVLPFVSRGARRLREELLALRQRGDLAGALRHLEARPPRWRRMPESRLYEALVHGALGARDQAAAALLQLATEDPLMRQARLWAALLLRGSEPAWALSIARSLHDELPRNPSAAGLVASCALAAGRLDEAAELLPGVLRARPRHGEWHALASRVATARGDRAAAAAHLARAERLAPGDRSTVIARAELALANGDRDSAEDAIAKLRALHTALPFAFLGGDLDRLERLARGERPAACTTGRASS